MTFGIVHIKIDRTITAHLLPGLLSSSSFSRCCWGSSNSSSSPPWAQPWCDDTRQPWSPAKRTAPLRTPTPTGSVLMMERYHPTLVMAPWWCPPWNDKTMWPMVQPSCGFLKPVTQHCPSFLIRQCVTCCWMAQYQYLSTRFLFSASVHTVKAPWGPKETLETAALQVSRLIYFHYCQLLGSGHQFCFAIYKQLLFYANVFKNFQKNKLEHKIKKIKTTTSIVNKYR